MSARTDFNDLAVVAGPEAVRKSIAAAVPARAAKAATDEPEPERWDDPLPFGRIETPELPHDLLPGVFGEYSAALSESLQTPGSMSVLFSITVLSLCLQRKVRVAPFGDDYTEPASLWGVILADSGERKSALIQRLLKPVLIYEAKLADRMKPEIQECETLRKINQRRIEKLQGDAAKEDSPVRRGELVREIADLAEQTPDEIKPKRLFMGDTTPERAQMALVEQGGVMAYMSDEGGILAVLAGLYSGGEAYLDTFLQAYSGSPIRVDRGSRVAVIDRPAVTFGLGMQPGLFQEMPPASKRKFRQSGFFARIWFGYPESRIGRRDMGRRVTISADLENRYRGAVLALLDIQPRSNVMDGEDDEHILVPSDAARELWVKFAQKIENDQADGGPLESMRDWCAKLPGGALRLAGLFHMADGGRVDAEISESTMTRAVGVCLRLIPHALAVFDLIGTDPSADDAKIVWRWIERHGGREFLRSEIYRAHHGRFTKIERLIQALDVLKGRNLIAGPYKWAGGGGRPPIFYRVNPQALKVA